MRSGSLRHRVTVETAVETGKDDRGQPIRTWNSGRIWMVSIERLQSRQLEIARQMYTDATHEVRGWWFDGLRETQRLNFQGRLFHIREVDDVGERHKEYRLVVAEDRTP